VTIKKVARDERDTPQASPAGSDVALIHGVTPDGEGFHILRARDNQLELGAVRPLREGVPITGEVVTLRPRAHCPVLCDVETHFKPPAQQADRPQAKAELPAPRSGPVQVATDEYRRNWDAIWSSASEKSKLVN
jgi:hypothetical protein